MTDLLMSKYKRINEFGQKFSACVHCSLACSKRLVGASSVVLITTQAVTVTGYGQFNYGAQAGILMQVSLSSIRRRLYKNVVKVKHD